MEHRIPTSLKATAVIALAPGSDLSLDGPGKACDAVLKGLAAVAMIVCSLTLWFIAGFMAVEAAPALMPSRLHELLFGASWSPLANPPSYGIRHAILSTLAVSVIALALATPLGIGCGLFLAEIAPRRLSDWLQSVVELLAGVPSVVYGFFGYVTLVPWFEGVFGMATGECLLAAGLVLAIMCLPFIANTSAEAFRAVEPSLRESALALGVTRWYYARRVLAAKAMPGLFGAVALGLARALGETLAVLMLAGNSLAVPGSLLDRGQPITALIATEIGEAGLGSPKYEALIAAGLVLMLTVGVINAVVWRLKNRLLHHESASL